MYNWGKYNFTHCTFANYFNGGFRQFPTLLINNFVSFTDDEGNENFIIRNLNEANFTNCIIDGNQNIEMILDKNESGAFQYRFKNNMIKFNDVNNTFTDDVLFDFENASLYTSNIFNGQAQFEDTELNKLQIGKESEAINKADLTSALNIPFDILGNNRSVNPDIGAYQHSEDF